MEGGMEGGREEGGRRSTMIVLWVVLVRLLTWQSPRS